MRDDVDPSQYGEADRREVDPPIQVETANLVETRPARLLGERTAGMVGSRARCRRSSTVDQSCGSSTRERLTVMTPAECGTALGSGPGRYGSERQCAGGWMRTACPTRPLGP